MKKTIVLSIIALSLVISGTAVQATLIEINPTGTSGSIPQGASNEVLFGIYGTNADRYGWYGSAVELSSDAYLTFTYLGTEAGYTNEFYFAGSSLFNNKTSSFLDSTMVGPVSSGVIDFSFYVNGVLGVANGSNPNDSTGQAGINFFVSFDDIDPATATTGNSLVVFLDDAGAGPDDNHDDMAIRISAASPVPEPAIMLLVGTGLIGLAGFSRRRLKK